MITENTPKVTVGDLATYGVGSDCYPYTVIAVSKSGYTVTLQSRTFRRTDTNGLSEMQDYETTADPNGRILKVRRGVSGKYYPARSRRPIHFGHARVYLDPSF